MAIICEEVRARHKRRYSSGSCHPERSEGSLLSKPCSCLGICRVRRPTQATDSTDFHGWSNYSVL